MKRNIDARLLEILSPFLQISRFSGLCPVTYYHHSGMEISLKTSRRLCVWSCASGIILGAWGLWGMLDDLMASPETSVRMANPKNKYVVFADICNIIVAGSLGMIMAPFRMEHFLRIAGIYQQIDEVIRSTGSVGNERAKLVRVITVVLVFFTMLLVNDWYTKVPLRGLKNYVPFYAMYYSVVLQQLQYWYMVRLVGTRLKMLNETLDMEDEANDRRFQFDNELALFSTSTAKAMLQVHQMICEIVDEINDWFGVTITLVLLGCLLHLVEAPYFLTLAIRNSSEPHVILIEAIWGCAHLFRLVMITEVCQYSLDLNQYTSTVVFKMLARESCKNSRKEIGSSVSTFLVILFQFS